MNRISITLAALLCCGGTSFADSPHPTLPQLFSQRAELRVEHAGLQAVSLPIELIRACRPGLSDLRLWTDGHEVPYLVDTTGPEDWKLAEKIDLKPTHISVDRNHPSCAPSPAQGEPATHCTSIDVKGLPRWEGGELVFEIEDARFVERVDLMLETPEHAPLIVKDQTLYRLPSGPGEQLRIPLPTAAHAGKLSILMQGQGAALTPKLRIERGQSVRGTDTVEALLAVGSTWHDRLGTHVVLERPLGVLPTALRLVTRTGTFDRAVKVYDGNVTESHRLVGEGRVLRVALPAGGQRVTVDRVDIPLGVPKTRKLELVIDDGDSPPLADLAVRAILRRPILVFDRDNEGLIEVLFGGGRVEAPRYDLQSLLPSTAGADGAEGIRAEIAARLRERQGMQRPVLGLAAANPSFDPTPALAPVMHAGAKVDLTHYTHARSLSVGAAPDGLSRYVLAPADLAIARADLGDIRIVDDAGQQWPYLVDHEVDNLVVELRVKKPVSKDGKTRYDFDLPAAPLTLATMSVDVAEGFFDRDLTLIVKDEAGRERATPNQHFARAFGDKQPITVNVGESRVSGVSLEIADGGDAPLRIESAHVQVPTLGLFIVAKPGRYRFVAGNPEEEPVRYDLRSLQDLIGQLDATNVIAEPLVENPTYSAASRLQSGGARERVLVWIVLAFAVLVLGGLTLRMARTES